MNSLRNSIKLYHLDSFNTNTMKLKTLFLIALSSISLTNALAQGGQVKEANKKYDNYSYVDAIKTYERVAAKGYKSVDMFQKLGNAYYFNAELIKANKWYEELFAMKQPLDAEYYYRYGQTLKATGNYKKSDEMMTVFNQKSGNDARAILFAKNKNYLEVIKANSARFTIEDAGINSDFYDSGAAIFGNKFVFSTTRETGKGTKNAAWTGQAFSSIYASEILSTGKLAKPEKFSKNLTTRVNEFSPIFTKDGQTVYFTRNNFNNGKKGIDSEKTTKLKIYSAKLDGSDWKDIKELPFDSDQYNVAHPALSPDEKTLYFASDMPGSFGLSDLFKVEIKDNGNFGVPINLGNVINTESRETFPFITENNELFFATDGRPGLGGLDIFVSQLDKGDKISDPVNVGAPINGKTDDFGLIYLAKSKSGFFTSNREGGKGFDDIYRFSEVKCNQELSGIVTDLTTGEILPNSEVILFDSSFKQIAVIMSDEKGYYKHAVDCKETYYVRTNKDLYATNEQKLTISKLSGKTDMPIKLDKKLKPIDLGTDLAKSLEIPIIYFDLDKSFIRPDAAVELAKVLDVMNQNPTIKIDVRSHTDCRQTASYNAALSDRRAKSTVAWLIKNGIKANRLTGKGYGESQLTNACGCEPTNESTCTEDQHQLNRRSEFIVVAK
jgi:outer membrane protein OmpA-like peptidoglycan-associated protein